MTPQQPPQQPPRQFTKEEQDLIEKEYAAMYDKAQQQQQAPPSWADIGMGIAFTFFNRYVAILHRAPFDRICWLIQCRNELRRQGKISDKELITFSGPISTATHVKSSYGWKSFWQGVNYRFTSSVGLMVFHTFLDPLMYRAFNLFSIAGGPGMVVGFLAHTTFTAAVVYPFDTINVKLSCATPKEAEEGGWAMMKRIVCDEGVGALYRGFWLSCLAGAINNLTYFLGVDTMTRLFPGIFKNPERAGLRLIMMLSLLFASNMLVFPLGTLRRRLQLTAGSPLYVYPSFKDLLATANGEGSYSVLYHGALNDVTRTVVDFGINYAKNFIYAKVFGIALDE